MKAMIFAAGLGTRLRPLTDDRPKALVEINGHTLLELTLLRLRCVGVNDVIINVHHYADMIVEFLKKNGNFGMRIEISRENVLLDTGGGLKKAAWFFTEALDYTDDGPFLLHNVDVISSIDFERMRQLHFHTKALATLAVQDRETSRHLLFDEKRELCGRRSGKQEPELIRPAQQMQAWAFSGIHIISPRIFSLLNEEGAFSVINAYLRLAGQGEKIIAFPADQYYWRDLGTPKKMHQAEQDLKQGIITQ